MRVELPIKRTATRAGVVAVAFLLHASLSCELLAQQSVADVIAHGKLSKQDGQVVVYYPEGSGRQAVAVQTLLSDALRFFGGRVAVRPAFTVVLLGRREWRAINPPSATYDQFLPGVEGNPLIMFLPAERGHALDRLIDQLWPDGGGPDSARFAALVGLHELGHVLDKNLRLPEDGPWFGEFVATYIAYSYLSSQTYRGREVLA